MKRKSNTTASALASESVFSFLSPLGGDNLCNSQESSQNDEHSGHPSISINSVNEPSIFLNAKSRTFILISQNGQQISVGVPSSINPSCIESNFATNLRWPQPQSLVPIPALHILGQ